MDLNDNLKKLSEFDEIIMQVFNTKGELESVKTYTQKDFKELHEQWTHKVEFDLNSGKIIS